MKANAQKISGQMSSTVANSYLVSGASFNDEPTLFLNGSVTAKMKDTYITFLGINSRNIKNHFNGKTSWIEWTGMLDISQNIGKNTVSAGAYYSFLPEDIFGLSGLNGIYGSFTTKTNPSMKIYLERGFKGINGTIGKAAISDSINVLGKQINAGFETGAMNDYFIKKKGLHYLSFDLNSEILSTGPLNVSAGLKYQIGIKDQAVTGLQGQLSAGYSF
jgi:hypothetical protein